MDPVREHRQAGSWALRGSDAGTCPVSSRDLETFLSQLMYLRSPFSQLAQGVGFPSATLNTRVTRVDEDWGGSPLARNGGLRRLFTSLPGFG